MQVSQLYYDHRQLLTRMSLLGSPDNFWDGIDNMPDPTNQSMWTAGILKMPKRTYSCWRCQLDTPEDRKETCSPSVLKVTKENQPRLQTFNKSKVSQYLPKHERFYHQEANHRRNGISNICLKSGRILWFLRCHASCCIGPSSSRNTTYLEWNSTCRGRHLKHHKHSDGRPNGTTYSSFTNPTNRITTTASETDQGSRHCTKILPLDTDSQDIYHLMDFGWSG